MHRDSLTWLKRPLLSDPYSPLRVVISVRSSADQISLNGGSWLPETRLAMAVTANGKIKSNTRSVVSDMIFSRAEQSTRFAFGDAGVFVTVNGFDWFTLLDAVAIPGRPEPGFFDPFRSFRSGRFRWFGRSQHSPHRRDPRSSALPASSCV